MNFNMEMQKAWFYEEYGPKEVLKLGNLPIPTPQHNQVLVQVHAAALNPIDFKRRLSPIFPSEFPVVPGCDMAGIVIGKGVDVTKFDIGDDVYGNIQDFNTGEKLKQLGTLAQFIVVEESLVARKPKFLSFEEAASLPLAVQTAMEGFTTAGFKKGQTIFVVAGAGGVGSLVVQLAKQLYGASYVVATTSTPKVEFVKQLGADKVVDYTKTKYEDIEEKFDFLYDTIDSGMDPTTQSSALAAYRPEKYKGNSGQQSHGSQKDRLWCEHCNKPYHTKETCWDLHGKPADWKTRSQRCTKTAYVANAPPASSSSGNLPFTVEQMEVLKKLLQPIKDNDTRAPKEIALLTHTGKISYSTSLLSYTGPQDAWIVDSGATDHMCSSSIGLLNFHPCTEDIGITVADGSLCKATGRGDLIVSGLQLKFVLYVPKLHCNLISVHKLHCSEIQYQFWCD